MLLKYPIGMQGLPLTDKFGMNGPAGGFLEAHQVALVTSVLKQEERDFLIMLSDADPNVQLIVDQFTSMPDLPEEEWCRQNDEYEKQHPHLKADKGENGN